jgi:hypothetical protein
VNDENSSQQAAVWEKDGPIWQLTLLPVPPETAESEATCITSFQADGPESVVTIVGGSALLQGAGAAHGHALIWIKGFEPLYKLGVLPSPGESDLGIVWGVAGYANRKGDGSEIMAVGSVEVDGGAFRRPVRWRKVGEEFQAFFLPKLPDGGPAGEARAIIRHEDGSMVILGRAEGTDGSLLPVNWDCLDGENWNGPMCYDIETEPPLHDLVPLAMAEGPLPGPVVGFGKDADGYSRGVLWEPDYAGGKLHDLTGLLGDSPGDQSFNAVAMMPDGRIAANLVPADDPDGPKSPAILVPAKEDQPDPCPADFDDDGDVDTEDLLHLLGCWGQSCGDVDGDGDTDSGDLLALLAAWGECP